jgi:hypothetical protein
VQSVLFWQKIQNPTLIPTYSGQSHFWILCFDFRVSGLSGLCQYVKNRSTIRMPHCLSKVGLVSSWSNLCKNGQDFQITRTKRHQERPINFLSLYLRGDFWFQAKKGDRPYRLAQQNELPGPHKLTRLQAMQIHSTRWFARLPHALVLARPKFLRSQRGDFIPNSEKRRRLMDTFCTLILQKPETSC